MINNIFSSSTTPNQNRNSQQTQVLMNQTFNVLNQAVNSGQPQPMSNLIGSIAHNINTPNSNSNDGKF